MTTAMDEVLSEEFRRRQRQRVKSCCKKFAAFLFSHIGLATMIVAYSIMGGFIFQALEAPEELKIRAEIAVWKNQTLDNLCAQTTTILNLTEPVHGMERLRVEMYVRLTEFQEAVRNAVKDKGWDGNDSTEVSQWSFAGALLYAVTVITTIGTYQAIF